MKKSIFITTTVLISCFGLAGLSLGMGSNPDSKDDKTSAVGSGVESSGLATTNQATTSLNEDQVRELQNLLKEEGYKVGDADGIIGSDTAAAIRQYQTDRDLEVTGIPNEQTLRSLAPESEQHEFFGLAPEFGEKEGMTPEKEVISPEKGVVTPEREGLSPDKNKDFEPMRKGY